MQNQVLTVTQLNYSVRHQLEREFGQIWLVGEISNLSQPVSGHWYLTLKDEQAQVRCAMFRMKNQRVTFQPRNGMQVLVRASVSLYEPRGDYQVLIETMQPAGDGLLQQQFEQLKMKLAAEGLFAQQHKKPLPAFVKRVGIITSASGAALQDILQILKRRDPSLQVVIYPTLVQGREATQEIVAMIRLANIRQECDVLIVGRGGGSLEDLWCFNEEAVAWAIYQSQLPIISAVGHETDVTIADFVADVRAPTPSAAAELVSRDQRERARQLQHQFERANLAFDRLWDTHHRHFTQLCIRLNAQHPAKQFALRSHHLAQWQQRLVRAMTSQLQHAQQRTEQLAQRLHSQHPQRQLQRQWQRLATLQQRLALRMPHIVAGKQRQLQQWEQRLDRNPLRHQVWHYQQQCDKLAQRMQFALEKQFSHRQQRFQQACAQLESLSPLKVLARGYSVTQNAQGHALCRATDVQLGDTIESRLMQGRLVSQVIAIQAE